MADTTNITWCVYLEASFMESILDSLAEKLGWYESDIATLKIDVEGFELDVLGVPTRSWLLCE
jgi:hypothetical protein